MNIGVDMRTFWRRAPLVAKRKLIFIILKRRKIFEKFYRIYVMHLESNLGKVFHQSELCFVSGHPRSSEVIRGQVLTFESRSGKQKLQILPALGKLLILAARYDEKDEEGTVKCHSETSSSVPLRLRGRRF